MQKTSKQIASIFSREIERLDQLSQQAPLDAADIGRLSMLVKALATYEPKELVPVEIGLDDLSQDELERLARNEGVAPDGNAARANEGAQSPKPAVATRRSRVSARPNPADNGEQV